LSKEDNYKDTGAFRLGTLGIIAILVMIIFFVVLRYTFLAGGVVP